MACRTKGEYAFLGAALFLIAPGAAERRVETMFVERLLEPFGLPKIGVKPAMVERVDPLRERIGVAMDDQLHSRRGGSAITQRVHGAKLPRRVDMEQRKGRRRRMEGLAREVEHHRAVLAHRVEHHGPLGLCDDLAEDVDALGFEPLKMGKGRVGQAQLPIERRVRGRRAASS